MSRIRLACNQGDSLDYNFTIYGHDGQVVPKAAIATLTARLFLPGATEAEDQFINDRNAQTILDENGGTVHATSGAAVLILGAADNVILDTAAAAAADGVEIHTLQIRLVLTNGRSRTWKRRVEVTDLRHVEDA